MFMFNRALNSFFLATACLPWQTTCGMHARDLLFKENTRVQNSVRFFSKGEQIPHCNFPICTQGADHFVAPAVILHHGSNLEKPSQAYGLDPQHICLDGSVTEINSTSK